EEINTRTAQVNAVTSLLDALTTETCAAGGRKTVAIRLVYHVLDRATADDLLLAIGEGADTGCAAVAVQAFQARMAEFAPELAAAQEVLLGAGAEDPGDDVARQNQVSAALRVVTESPYASLVLPTVVQSALLDGEAGSEASISEVIRSDETLRFARRSPLLAELGDAFVQSERGEALQIDPERLQLWERVAAPAN
ncbi:MAG: hypothetical protein R6W77_12375, partial [Trueperaceae bacterium]